ncbi:MAG TPA: trehalose-6-phosphate synthase, partial [Polyangiaceae bacterium]|nr:trehalose-6-phosphate synthase [Polyangiaceae bacterium]
MKNGAARFLLVLLTSLGLLTWSAYYVLVSTTRSWFERDIQLRARLAVASAEVSLIAAWRANDANGIAAILARIARDERIMGAAVCPDEGKLAIATSSFPAEFTCAAIHARAREHALRADGAERSSFTAELAGGPVQVSIHGIGAGDSLGSIVLVHDLSFVRRRERTTRNQALAGFFILAACASVMTMFAAHFAWRHWIEELREALAGRASRDFQPLAGDLRELVERLSQESETGTSTGRWTPDRLKEVLRRHLRGERVVLLANREPYIHERSEAGEVSVVHPASGLVTALEPVMRTCSGTWVAHGGGSADRESVDASNRVRVPPGEESYWLRRVWLSSEEDAGYYYGFSNEGLWPLCHLAHTRPIFRAADFAFYKEVNAKFAQAVCEEVDIDDPIILVQDYHFALAPRMIRERLPAATILTFWHIPWPNPERFGICPWRNEILDGLLGSSIVGFQTHQHCNNFLDAVDAFIESRIDRELRAVVQRSRSTLVRPYPISIEWPVRHLRGVRSPEDCRTE